MRRPTISLTSCGRWLRPRRASVLRRSAILRKCARWSSHTSIESGADAGLHDRLLGRPHGAMRSPAVVCSGSLRFKPPLATCAARRAHDQASSEPSRRPSGRRTKGGLLGLDQMVEAGAGARVVPGARRKPGRAAEIRADLFSLICEIGPAAFPWPLWNPVAVDAALPLAARGGVQGVGCKLHGQDPESRLRDPRGSVHDSPARRATPYGHSLGRLICASHEREISYGNLLRR